MQLNFDIPIPFIPEPERKKSPREKKETVNTNPQSTQLDFLHDAPRKPEPVRLSRPDHKPYETGSLYMKDYFILQGAFLNWHRIFGAFSHFLSQKDPSGKKERIFHWEGKKIKVENYRWREFEGYGEIYRNWCPFFRNHLKGWTTDYFDHPQRIQDFITEKIEATE